VIADGIESPTRRAVLEAVGCDLGQGRLLTGSMHG
jgi:EAL domain-containing protein (putative c-di-GMP-specific phosphodiesterase class I)